MAEYNDQNDFNVIMTKKGLNLARRISLIDPENITVSRLSELKQMAKDMIPKRIFKETW
tara:strand:- start:198 stop:374 length:177 start_codon:yes stop_codon:yes gene_type:complete